MAIVFDAGLFYVRTVPDQAIEKTSAAGANQLGGNANSNFAEIAGCKCRAEGTCRIRRVAAQERAGLYA